MAVTFDGDNLLIILETAVTSVDAEVDLYSDWKEWVKLSDNAKYPSAFRAIGGDTLPGGLTAGSYYFIRNDNGWRIRPPEEDINITITGSLVPEDSTLDILVPTVGTYTVLVSGIQPVTQGTAALPGNVWDFTLTSGNTAEQAVEQAVVAAQNTQP